MTKSFILLSLVLSSSLYASNGEKCLNQIINLRLALSARAGIANFVNDQNACSQMPAREMNLFNEKKSQLQTSKRLVLKELATKKKVSSVIYAGVYSDSDKDRNEQEICQDLQSVIDEVASSNLSGGGDGCSDISKTNVAKVASIDFLSSDFSQACGKYVSALKEGKQAVADCEKQKKLDREPREEITQDEPIPKKSEIAKKINNNPRNKKLTAEDMDKLFNPGKSKSKASGQ